MHYPRHLRARSSLTTMIAIAIAAAAPAACGPTTTVEQTWTSGQALGQPPLKRVVTVFFSENETLRRAGEDQLARELAAKGVQATPAYAVLSQEEQRNLDTVKSKLLAQGYDGIVTMRIVDRYQELEYMPSTFDGYWGYASPYFYSPGFYSPGYAYTETVVRVETTAYSLRTNRLMWSALTRTVGDEARALIDDTSDVVAEQLTRRGLAG